MKDYQITLHQVGTEEVTIMALMAKTVKEAINHAHRCMGQGWFTVTIVEAAWMTYYVFPISFTVLTILAFYPLISALSWTMKH